jgi:hypothetical protein
MATTEKPGDEVKTKNKRLVSRFKRPKPIRGVDPIYEDLPNYNEDVIRSNDAACSRRDVTRVRNVEFPEGVINGKEHVLVKGEVRTARFIIRDEHCYN